MHAKHSLWKEVWKNKLIYLLISPFFIVYTIFGLFPLLYSVFLSFHSWKGTGAMKFVGLLNFSFLFKDSIFTQSIVNTLIIWVISTIPMIILAMVVAFILNSGALKLRDFFRAAYFLPNVTSIIAVAIIFTCMFGNTYGIINYFLASLGLEAVPWNKYPLGVQFVISMMIMWRWMGYNAIIFLAGLQKISTSYYEAARIDGANSFQIFKNITVPLLNPVILFVVITSTIGGWQVMAEPAVYCGNFEGGIGRAGMTVVLYLYNKAFLQRQFGYGAALSWALFLIIVVFSIINWRMVSRDTE